MKVKLSYLIVGHTHEDIDQYFSVISRFFKKIIMSIYSIVGFLTALMSCFKTRGCIPRCNTIGKKTYTLVKENTPRYHKIKQECGFTQKVAFFCVS